MNILHSFHPYFEIPLPFAIFRHCLCHIRCGIVPKLPQRHSVVEEIVYLLQCLAAALWHAEIGEYDSEESDCAEDEADFGVETRVLGVYEVWD